MSTLRELDFSHASEPERPPSPSGKTSFELLALLNECFLLRVPGYALEDRTNESAEIEVVVDRMHYFLHNVLPRPPPFELKKEDLLNENKAQILRALTWLTRETRPKTTIDRHEGRFRHSFEALSKFAYVDVDGPTSQRTILSIRAETSVVGAVRLLVGLSDGTIHRVEDALELKRGTPAPLPKRPLRSELRVDYVDSIPFSSTRDGPRLVWYSAALGSVSFGTYRSSDVNLVRLSNMGTPACDKAERRVREILKRHPPSSAQCVRLSPTKKHLCVASKRGELLMYDFAGDVLSVANPPMVPPVKPISSQRVDSESKVTRRRIAFAPDGSLVAFSKSSWIGVFDVYTLEIVFFWTLFEEPTFTALAFSPDSRILIATTETSIHSFSLAASSETEERYLSFSKSTLTETSSSVRSESLRVAQRAVGCAHDVRAHPVVDAVWCGASLILRFKGVSALAVFSAYSDGYFHFTDTIHVGGERVAAVDVDQRSNSLFVAFSNVVHRVSL